MTDNNTFLVVGLGNPGAEYAGNRHNIGFKAVEALAAHYGAIQWKEKFNGLLAEASGNERIYFLKPQTYMNLSGESAGAVARFYKIPPERIIVLHDDIDLLTGKLRVKRGGGSGGHNGIKSLDAHIGENYWRARIGVGPSESREKTAQYVLSDFIRAEREVYEKMLPLIVKYFDLLIKGDAAGFMNKIALAASGSPPPLRGRVREGGDPISHARKLRSNMTEAEKLLWYHLRRENLSKFKFRRQHPLDKYIADFVCLEKKLIVEVDGSQHAETTKEDSERSAFLAKTGHKVLRFWNNDVLENIKGVLQTIESELQAR